MGWLFRKIWAGAGANRSPRGSSVLMLLLVLVFCRTAAADINVSVSGPAGLKNQTLAGDGGAFDVNLPLAKNAVNTITVTATDDYGNIASKDISLTQISFDSLVVAQVKAEPLPPSRVEQLVNEGVIQLDNPENFNVSQFDIVLTIGQELVPISVPIALPKEIPFPEGYETYKLPRDEFGGNRKPNEDKIEIVVFEKLLEKQGEIQPPPIPGVIIIEGKIKSLKEFFSVRLLLMNTSGIFTLSDVVANLEFPNGGLSNVLPADGIAAMGDILPGSGTQPGQKEKEFIIRGDELGERQIKVNYGGKVTGPGIPEDAAIPFNGSAPTSVIVKGPPTFLVQVTHPDVVVEDVNYELVIDITNTGETPALYASLDLDVGADANLVNCVMTGDTPLCTEIEGAVTRSLGHIYPAVTVRESFTVKPKKTGPISSCMGVSDQNITLQVLVGAIGCLTGKFPPESKPSDSAPTVTVLPAAEQPSPGLWERIPAWL